MRSQAWFVVLLVLGVAACGGDDDDSGKDKAPPSHRPDSGLGSRTCMDGDDDGFGRYCDEGDDCDDEDPSVTDECVRCVTPNKGCPCEPGTPPMSGCKPPDMRTVVDGQVGTLVCSEGIRYCRDGAWTDCEILAQYSRFIAD